MPDVLIQPHSAAIQVVFKFAAWLRTVPRVALVKPPDEPQAAVSGRETVAVPWNYRNPVTGK